MAGAKELGQKCVEYHGFEYAFPRYFTNNLHQLIFVQYIGVRGCHKIGSSIPVFQAVIKQEQISSVEFGT